MRFNQCTPLFLDVKVKAWNGTKVDEKFGISEKFNLSCLSQIYPKQNNVKYT